MGSCPGRQATLFDPHQHAEREIDTDLREDAGVLVTSAWEWGELKRVVSARRHPCSPEN